MFGKDFDRRWGVDTFGKIDLEDLAIESENHRFGVYYEPSPILTFNRMLGCLPDDLEPFTFVDFGCGKGRALLAARHWRFKRIIGVEFSTELCEVALANAERLGAQEIEIVAGDAAKFTIPDGPCVLYFYNPFDAPVLDLVISNIVRSYRANPRKMYVVYLNAIESSRLFDDVDFLTLRRRGKILFDPGAERRRPYAIWES